MEKGICSDWIMEENLGVGEILIEPLKMGAKNGEKNPRQGNSRFRGIATELLWC